MCPMQCTNVFKNNANYRAHMNERTFQMATIPELTRGLGHDIGVVDVFRAGERAV